MTPDRNVALFTAVRRPPTTTPTQRAIYELARLRVADLREPAPRFSHLVRTHD
jgi:hypothetical protein